MSRKLANMSWREFKQELSIAGRPDNIIEIGRDVEALIFGRINFRNIPEVMNIQIMLEKIKAEWKQWEGIERSRQHPRITKPKNKNQ